MPKEAIKEYQKVYFEEYGKEISEQEALTQLQRLMQLCKLFTHQKQVSVDKDCEK